MRRHKLSRTILWSLSHWHADWICICFLASASLAVDSWPDPSAEGHKKISHAEWEWVQIMKINHNRDLSRCCLFFSGWWSLRWSLTTWTYVWKKLVHFFTWFSTLNSSVVMSWLVISGGLLLFCTGARCGSTNYLWLYGNFRRRQAVELSDPCTCHHALQISIHWILVLLSYLKQSILIILSFFLNKSTALISCKLNHLQEVSNEQIKKQMWTSTDYIN